MLLEDNPSTELDDADSTNLIRLLIASVRKAVGERIVPATDNRNPYQTKAHKVGGVVHELEIFCDSPCVFYLVFYTIQLKCCFINYQEMIENNRRNITVSMVKAYPQLLRKFMSDKGKVAPLVEVIIHMNLELYPLKRQGQVDLRACFDM